jgi:DNA mismatch endonuclease (patch repair protein)
MRKVPSRNTIPEIALRKALWAAGLRYRIHLRVGGRETIDIAFPGCRVGVLVDGCFWHSCPSHKATTFGGPNARLWQAKLARTIERDHDFGRRLVMAGWQVLRFWECEIRSNVDRICDEIVRTVHMA